MIYLGFGLLVSGQCDELPSTIAFGSCAHQDKPQPILRRVVERKPDLFVYLGDNVYADTYDMERQRAIYARYGKRPELQALRKAMPVFATWDDHDYAANDMGKEFSKKEASRENFREFWGIEEDDPQAQHEGIYGLHTYSNATHTLQVIILDSRFFRDLLLRNPRGKKPAPPFKNDYRPDPNPEKTLLGDAQWTWLEECLKAKADVRIIASSIQFGHEYNGWESWTNLPAEQERMVDLIRKTGANGVVFISGDVHWAEISRRQIADGWDLYDITASGINRDWYNVEPNKFRVGEAYRRHHYGEIHIHWEAAEEPTLEFRIIGLEGTVVRSHNVGLGEISKD